MYTNIIFVVVVHILNKNVFISITYSVIGANWFNLGGGGGLSPDYLYIEFLIVCEILINWGAKPP